MSETRAPSKRLPVACEPCRARKIRCSRDGTPCSTCVRRRAPHCRYLKRTWEDAPATTGYQQSTVAASSACETSDLAQRVQRLEQLIHEPGTTLTGYHGGIVEHHVEAPSAQVFSPPSSNGYQHPRAKNLSGSLRRTARGHVRFIPKSHPWSNDQDAIAFTAMTSPDTAFPERQAARKELLSRLPPASQCTELVNIYFRSFASLFHILHDPTFTRQYEAFLDDEDSVSLAWLALLFAVLATAVLALESDNPVLHDLNRGRRVGKATELMDRYRSAAMACLDADQYLWNQNVTTLQALILIIYCTSHSHGGTWTLIGLAHHLAVSIGCHVDPSEFGLGPIESEERRRCWSGLMMLYTAENMSMGSNSLPHHLLPANSRPPADVDDEQLGVDSQQAPWSKSATQMTYLLSKFRLHDICSELCDRILNAEGATAYPVVLELDTAIEKERKSWDARYLDTVSEAVQLLPVHHQAHVRILHIYSNHLLLLLHHAALSPDSSLSALERHWSENRLVESALRLLRTHEELQTSSNLVPFRWYSRGLGSFHALHAATVLFGFRRSPAGQQRILEINEALKSCADHSEAMKEASKGDPSLLCHKAAPALRYLCSRLAADDNPPAEALNRPGELEPWIRGYTARPLASQPLNALASPSNSQESATCLPHDAESVLQQFQPQQWLTPGGLLWDQWDHFLAHTSTTDAFGVY